MLGEAIPVQTSFSVPYLGPSGGDFETFDLRYPSFSTWNKRILVIPDIHQNVDWAKAIMKSELHDQIVFLGDFFDSSATPPLVWGVRQTAKFYAEVLDGVYGPATVLLGNHDVPYRESYAWNHGGKKKLNLYNGCSGFSHNRSREINKEMTRSLWEKTSLFHVANGWLLSHAGINAKLYEREASVLSNLDYFAYEASNSLANLTVRRSAFMGVGSVRKGDDAFGGITWQDWDKEFEPCPIRQIVGHSGQRKTVRQKGNSFCIDGYQSTYAIIEPNGGVFFKNFIDNTKGSSLGFWYRDDTASS